MPVNNYLVLAEPWVLKSLEKPSVYNPVTDELFELNRKAFDFLKKCASRQGQKIPTRKNQFINDCLESGLLVSRPGPRFRKFILKASAAPSLRYLLVHITDVCNLRCRHCYLGTPAKKILSLATIKKILAEFENIQGLRLLISGGEPRLHPDFWKINKILPAYHFRKILLTNGLFFQKKDSRKLYFDEIQISLDGLKAGHEALRGRNTFKKTLAAIKLLKKRGSVVSVSTMVHSRNLTEFKGLEKLIKNLAVDSWTVDTPYQLGRLPKHPDLLVTPKTAAAFLNYGFGPEGHGIYGRFACGPHLMAVMADGRTDKCGYFLNRNSPRISQGLEKCFLKIKKIPLKILKCRGCRYLLQCRGGCRARAGGALDRDLYMCYYNFGGEQNEN